MRAAILSVAIIASGCKPSASDVAKQRHSPNANAPAITVIDGHGQAPNGAPPPPDPNAPILAAAESEYAAIARGDRDPEINPVTFGEYDNIRTGMSYSRVAKIIGRDGIELSSNSIPRFTTVMYSWSNSNGSNMNAVFQNGRLVQKAQFGLR